MNERFRTLLDDAVSELEPADQDPVAAIVGRGRGARRRAVGAGALALVVLAGGAVVAGERLGGGGGDPVAAVDTGEPPTPRLVGDTVVAGDVHVPVPEGWRVVVADPKAPCVDLTETVLISGPEKRGCQSASIEVFGAAMVGPAGIAVLDRGNLIPLPPTAYTLRGGAPAWVTDPVTSYRHSPEGKAAGYSYFNSLVLPWSKVMVTVRVPGPQQRQIFESITVTPSPRADRLNLPDPVAWAELVLPVSGSAASPRHATLTDARDIDALLRLLRAQKTTVDGPAACTSPEQPVARLTLSPVEEHRIKRATASAAPVRPVPSTSVIIGFGECREAVTADGGRVRLTQETVDTLMRLFGLGTR